MSIVSSSLSRNPKELPVYKDGVVEPLPEDCKILIEKEYKSIKTPLPGWNATIALTMMVKNEERRIHVSLESVVGVVDALIIFDTGSTDRTVDIITEFCEKHRINLYMISGSFVNFCVSRNVLLHYCNRFEVEFLLMLDCNDELRGGNELIKFCKDMREQPNSGFLICQQWWSGVLDKYFNIRLIKNRHSWFYHGSVHEYIKDNSVGPNVSDPAHPIWRVMDTIVLYQDRTKDDNKSSKRFVRDRELLLKEYKEGDPKDIINYSRALFYLAQTCECLGLIDEVLFFSKLRLEYKGFDEEVFHSYMRCGRACLNMKQPWEECLRWFIKAYEHTNRVEPLIAMADHYAQKQLWYMAYMFIHQALGLLYPEHLILFIDKSAYDYTRFHLAGKICFHVGQFAEGEVCCRKALETGLNKELDTGILQQYLNKKKSGQNPQHLPLQNIATPNLTKVQFMEKTIHELKTKYPTLPIKSVQSRATKLWKERKTNQHSS